MFVVTHALTGGLIASKIPNPIISYPLIFATHFLMDRIPHSDFGSEIKRSNKLGLFLGGLTDSALAILVCWFVFLPAGRQATFNLKLWAGIFISILPDLIELPTLLLEFRPFPLNKFEHFHSRLWHRKAPFLIGLIPQIVIISLISLLK